VDGKKNQDELGVDCGGVCVRQCAELLAPIKILWAKAFESRPGVYYAVAMVENPNLDSVARNVAYTIRLLDASGVLIAERSGKTYVLPKESFPIFEGNIITGETQPSRVEVVFDRNISWDRRSPEPSVFKITDRQLTSADTRPRLTATIHNDGATTYRDISVSAIISDKTGSPVGASKTLIDVLTPGEAKAFALTWSQPFAYTADAEVCTQPVDVILALDRSGSMASDAKDPPQPLTLAKQAAADFVSRMTVQDQVGYVSFATEASSPIDQELSSDRERVRDAILRTTIRTNGVQYTNIGDALAKAYAEFQTQRRNPDAKGVLILLTDGAPTYPKDPNNPKFPEQYARQVADTLKRSGVEIYTIGLGDEINQDLLLDLASSPQQYYSAATGADLSQIYRTIASAVCKKDPPLIQFFPRLNNAP
jgi:Mg-chelatase subunit ChlD